MTLLLDMISRVFVWDGVECSASVITLPPFAIPPPPQGGGRELLPHSGRREGTRTAKHCPRDTHNHGTELAMKVVRQARLELNGGSTPDLLRPPQGGTVIWAFEDFDRDGVHWGVTAGPPASLRQAQANQRSQHCMLGLQGKGVFLSFLKTCLPPPNRASRANHSPPPEARLPPTANWDIS